MKGRGGLYLGSRPDRPNQLVALSLPVVARQSASVGVFKRGPRWYMELPNGKQLSTKLDATDENLPRAEAMLAQVVVGLSVPSQPRVLTVEQYFRKWIAVQEYSTRDDDKARLQNHAMPEIGSIELSKITIKDIRAFVTKLKSDSYKSPLSDEPLAPRTKRAVYDTLKRMFKSAVQDELLLANPCALEAGQLPAIEDADPEWREEAVFEPTEMSLLISDPRVSWARRVAYALIFLSGPRSGELQALRWRSIQKREAANGEPELLDCLVYAKAWDSKKKVEGKTKTGDAKYVPVHPILAVVLAEWKSVGWAQTYGREPTEADFVVPKPFVRGKGRRTGGPETQWYAGGLWKELQKDLRVLGLRPRAIHDGRATFITHAGRCRCADETVRRWTHPPRKEKGKDAHRGYIRYQWPDACAEMKKIWLPGFAPDGKWQATDSLTDSSPNHPESKENELEPAGVEPAHGMGRKSSGFSRLRAIEAVGRLRRYGTGRNLAEPRGTLASHCLSVHPGCPRIARAGCHRPRGFTSSERAYGDPGRQQGCWRRRWPGSRRRPAGRRVGRAALCATAEPPCLCRGA